MSKTPEKKIHYEKYVKYAQILEKTKWANEFSWNHIRRICNYIHPVSAKKGAVVFKDPSCQDQGRLERIQGELSAQRGSKINQQYTCEGIGVARVIWQPVEIEVGGYRRPEEKACQLSKKEDLNRSARSV